MSSIDPYTFCREVLPRVSRTFAININILKGELHRAVLCGYLFCRIVDTLEDSSDLSTTVRASLMDEYITFFADGPNRQTQMSHWTQPFFSAASSGAEYSLLANLPIVFELYQTLSEHSQSAIRECVVEMAQGMKKTLMDKDLSGCSLCTLETVADLEQYCYYVAGTVGLMLSKLFIRQSQITDQSRLKVIKAGELPFAIGLQMTNIIKDCHDDFQRGWCYIPEIMMRQHNINAAGFFEQGNRQKSLAVLNELITMTASRLDRALEYTLALPRSQPRIRLFNLWSLFFAIKTLASAWNNSALLDGKLKVKITRRDVNQTLWQTGWRVTSDSLLRRLYQKYRSAIPRC